MLQKKICLLGAFSVGKTSLIKQYVSSLFDERYLTTVGVKIDKKVMQAGDRDIMLMIWDLAGEDDYNALQTSYLRGAAGIILVADGTRPHSLDTALTIADRTHAAIGDVPSVLALNKVDLEDEWTLTDAQIDTVGDRVVHRTSARTGAEVDALFESLVGQLL